MEKLKDILDNIKERFLNPLFFSFICSWMAVNWHIVIALLFYDTKEIGKEKYSSIYQFIEKQLSISGSLSYPILIAVVYTLLMPVIKGLIRVFYSKIESLTEELVLGINKNGKVSVGKYLKLRENYQNSINKLEKVIDIESGSLLVIQQKDKELYEAKAEIVRLTEDCNNMYNINRKSGDVTVLNGFWTNNYKDISHPTKHLEGTEHIFIENGAYHIIDNLGNRMHVFNIKNFYFNNDRQSVFFVKDRIGLALKEESGNLKYNINELKMDNKEILSGMENGTTVISYQRTQI